MITTAFQHKEIIAALLPDNQEGVRLLAERWEPSFMHFLSLIRHRGCETEFSGQRLGLFIFTQPSSALYAIFSALSKIKKELQWPVSSGPFPVKIVFDQLNNEETRNSLFNYLSPFWNILDSETIHTTRALKLQWPSLTRHIIKEQPTFTQASDGIYQINIIASKFSDEQVRPFPQRVLSTLGKTEPCFYCGMNIHPPSKCPSKFLSPKQPSFQAINQFPLDVFTEKYITIFSEYSDLTHQLSQHPSSADIKKDINLQTFISYFNVFETFQLRFFWKNTFSPFSKWRNESSEQKLNVDSVEFVHAYDALRLSKHFEADRLFAELAINTASQKRRFYATIGRAFSALEAEGLFAMSPYLRAAISVADDEKGQIYSRLLFARYCCLVKNYALARKVVEEIFAIKPDCLEASYLDLLLKIKLAKRNEDVLGILQANSCEHQYIILLLLLDPQLLTAEGLIHEVMFSQLQVMIEIAEGKLKETKQLCAEAIAWGGKEDRNAKSNIEMLHSLEKQFERKNFSDLLTINSKTEGVTSSCKRIIQEKIDEITNQINALVEFNKGLQRFWKNFSFKSFYKIYEKDVFTFGEQTKQAEDLLKKIKTESVQELKGLVAKIQKDCEELVLQREKMLKVKEILETIIVFGKKLLTAELVVMISVSALMMGIFILPESILGQSLPSFFKTFERQLYIFSAVILSPGVALFLTLGSPGRK